MTMDNKLLQQQQNSTNAHGGGASVSGKPPTLQQVGGGAMATPPSPSSAGGPTRLFISSRLEPRDEMDEKHERCFQTVMSLITDKSEKDAHDALSSAVSKDPKTHEEVSVGFLVAILSPVSAVDPGVAARHYRDLTLVSRDGLQCVL